MSPIHETTAPSSPLQLTVKTGDSQNQILVLDSRGRLLQRGLGPRHEFALPQGIYRVKVLTGVEAHEKAVVLSEQQNTTIEFDPAPFVSPVPLSGTRSSHEYHVTAANDQSKKSHVHAGAGSSLFFFVRHWSPSSSQSTRFHLDESPATGLSLFAISAHEERKVCDLTAGDFNLEHDPWAACAVVIDPGVYELRLALPSGETLHQSFVASPGWQTQAFMLMRAYGTPTETPAPAVWRTDLTQTSIQLSTQGGFSPNEPMLRLAELARVSLAIRRRGAAKEAARRLLPNDLRALLNGKFKDPMLGIYGAHLLLLESSVDFSLFGLVVTTLRSMLGMTHPDVEALALDADIAQAFQPFQQPPMLRRSWELLVNASVAQPSLVAEPLASREPGRLLSEGPWHIWQSSSAEAAAAREESGDEGLAMSDVEAALAEEIGVMKALRRSKRKASQEGSNTSSGLPPGVVFQLVTPHAKDTPPDLEVNIDDDRLRRIVGRFGITPHQVKAALRTLETKMVGADGAPNLKLTFGARPEEVVID